MGRCSSTNLPSGEEEKGPECCMSIESIDWQYWQGFKKSLFYQWKQRQGIVCLKANLCGGRLVEWWSEYFWFLSCSSIFWACAAAAKTVWEQYVTIIWAPLSISIIVNMSDWSVRGRRKMRECWNIPIVKLAVSSCVKMSGVSSPATKVTTFNHFYTI